MSDIIYYKCGDDPIDLLHSDNRTWGSNIYKKTEWHGLLVSKVRFSRNNLFVQLAILEAVTNGNLCRSSGTSLPMCSVFI